MPLLPDALRAQRQKCRRIFPLVVRGEAVGSVSAAASDRPPLAGEWHFGHDLSRRIYDLERRLGVRVAFLDGAVEQDLGTRLAGIGDRLIEVGEVETLRIRLKTRRRPDVKEVARHGPFSG